MKQVRSNEVNKVAITCRLVPTRLIKRLKKKNAQFHRRDINIQCDKTIGHQLPAADSLLPLNRVETKRSPVLFNQMQRGKKQVENTANRVQQSRGAAIQHDSEETTKNKGVIFRCHSPEICFFPQSAQTLHTLFLPKKGIVQWPHRG